MNDIFLLVFIIAIVYFIVMIMLYKFVYNIGKRRAYELYKDNNLNVVNTAPVDNAILTEKCTTSCDLLPVHEPLFNLKEIVKQMVLLEDHLFHEQKRCRECITKHFLTIIALAEEGLTLDTDKMYEEDFEKILKETIEFEDLLHKTNDFESVAFKLRNLRKSFMSKIEPWIS